MALNMVHPAATYALTELMAWINRAAIKVGILEVGERPEVMARVPGFEAPAYVLFCGMCLWLALLVPLPSPTMKFFPTQLETYRNCPRKYFYSRDRELRARYAKASPHLVLGNAVHDALQLFFDVAKTDMKDRTYERLCDLMRDAWAGRGLFKRNGWKARKAREEAFGGDREKEASWGKKGLNILYRFFNYEGTDLSIVPLTSEQFFEMRLADGITLGGKIDRIDRLEDGSLVVVDYKTGKPPRTSTSDALAASDLQMSAYALIVKRKFRGTVKTCRFLYLDHLGNEIDYEFEPTDELLIGKEAELLSVCQEIQAEFEKLERPDEKDGAFEPTPNALCNWCDYQEICPKGQEWEKGRGGGTEQAEIPF